MVQAMMGRSRAKAWTPVGAAAKPGTGRASSCPQCPAQPHRSCLRWVSERWTESVNGAEVVHRGGRWDRMVSMHSARTKQALTGPLAVLTPKLCTVTTVHPGHNHGDNLYCRGSI